MPLDLLPLVLFTAVIIALIAVIFLRPRRNDDFRLTLAMEDLPNRGLRAMLLDLSSELKKGGIDLSSMELNETTSDSGSELVVGRRVYTVWKASDVAVEHRCAEMLVQVLNDLHSDAQSRRRATLEVVKEEVFLYIREML